MITKEQLKSIGKSPFDAVKLGVPLYKFRNGCTPYLLYNPKTNMFIPERASSIRGNLEVYSIIDDKWYDNSGTLLAVEANHLLSVAFASRMEAAVEKNKELLNCMDPITFAKLEISLKAHIQGRRVIDEFSRYDFNHLDRVIRSIENMIANSLLGDNWWYLYFETVRQLSDKCGLPVMDPKVFMKQKRISVQQISAPASDRTVMTRLPEETYAMEFLPEDLKVSDRWMEADTRHTYGEEGVKVLNQFSQKRYLLMSTIIVKR